VLDLQGRPIGDSRVGLTSSDGLNHLTARSGRGGAFSLGGIPPGRYALLIDHEGFSPYSCQDVIFEPEGVRCATVRLARPQESPGPGPAVAWADLSDDSSRSVIDAFQVQSLPSANNVWSLLENQDFSATTNRIDVGGVWASLPALWSSRGSVSWTQSSYLLNGLDATDPYDTGRPLFYPDIEALQFVTHSNGRHPVAYLSPGGAFDMLSKEGTPGFHGAVGAYYTSPGMSSSSVPSRLKEEGLTERTRISSLGSYNVQLSGPVMPRRLLAFASFSRLDLTRDVAQFDREDRGTVSSALVNLTYLRGRSTLQVLWTGQAVRHPTAGTGRLVPESATLDEKDLYNVFQLIWRTRFTPQHSLEVGAAFNKGNLHSRFQDGITAPHGEEIFKKIPSGAAASAGRDDRTTVVLQGTGQLLVGGLSNVQQRIGYGFSLRGADASAETEILGNVHLHYQGEEPFEVVLFDTPLHHRERSFEAHVFLEDEFTFGNLSSLSLGVHLVSTRGWAPRAAESAIPTGTEGGKIDWFQAAPRLSFSLPFLTDKSLVFRVSAARYYFHLPLQYLAYGNPQACGGLAYPWTDLNHDGQFQSGEEGRLWRREGPLYASIDPELKRPFCDEYSVSFTKVFRGGLRLTLAGFYRETRDLVETLNIGVPLTAYSPVDIYDPGDDATPGNHDDQYLTVYNQDKGTLGDDFFWLTNPDSGSRVNRYRGLDLTLVKAFGATVFFFSGTATEANGTASPGNTEYENDDGIIGALYDNPNASLFAKGRLRFDRAYTARLGLSIPLPLGFRLAGLVKYYDGLPFTRKIIVTGFNQGPFYVQAFYRGQARCEFNMTVDLRVEKAMAVGKTRARFFLDAYNVFDWALATAENEWSGPEFTLRFATEVQSPRVFRVGIRYEF
jgi:hypothetical protein